MKKVVATLVLAVITVSFVDAVTRDTKTYASEHIDARGKIANSVTIKVIDPADASHVDRHGGDILGYLGDPACGAVGLREACAVIADPNGNFEIKEVNATMRQGADHVGFIRGSKIRHVGDKYFKGLAVVEKGHGDSRSGYQEGEMKALEVGKMKKLHSAEMKDLEHKGKMQSLEHKQKMWQTYPVKGRVNAQGVTAVRGAGSYNPVKTPIQPQYQSVNQYFPSAGKTIQ